MPADPNYLNMDRAITAFLSYPPNRACSTFLNNVWNGEMTEARRSAVRRIMVERGWRFTEAGIFPPAQGDVTPSASGAAEVPARDEPATCDEARHIPNGQFTVQAGDEEEYKFRIFTIVRTMNEGLKNKRVISYFNEDTVRWETFAFLTTSGRVKVWRRFSEQGSEGWQLAARQLLHMLRQSRGPHLAVLGEDTDALGVHWNYSATTFTCRYCANSLTGTAHIQNGHDNCSSYRSLNPTPPPAPVPRPTVQAFHTTWHGPEQRPRVAAPVRPTSREVSTMSQVSGTWEQ